MPESSPGAFASPRRLIDRLVDLMSYVNQSHSATSCTSHTIHLQTPPGMAGHMFATALAAVTIKPRGLVEGSGADEVRALALRIALCVDG